MVLISNNCLSTVRHSSIIHRERERTEKETVSGQNEEKRNRSLEKKKKTVVLKS